MALKLFYSKGWIFVKIILQQRMDFVTSEAWVRSLKAFSEGQKIPSTSLGKTFLKCLVTLAS